jgi:hypothetical protein
VNGGTSTTAVQFTFNSDKPDATFVCKLDAGAYAVCKSPYVKTLKAGAHTFTVLAKRLVGTPPGVASYDPTPVTVIWIVQ